MCLQHFLQGSPCPARRPLSQSFPTLTGHVTLTGELHPGCARVLWVWEHLASPPRRVIRYAHQYVAQRRGYNPVSPYRVKITATTSRTTDSARIVPTHQYYPLLHMSESTQRTMHALSLHILLLNTNYHISLHGQCTQHHLRTHASHITDNALIVPTQPPTPPHPYSSTP